ncbi:MAG: hypothetical protein K2W96_10015 [Gemmataceae bacterium]|nr:hypothetical protein [Gemmataceae bacterium]
MSDDGHRWKWYCTSHCAFDPGELKVSIACASSPGVTLRAAFDRLKITAPLR